MTKTRGVFVQLFHGRRDPGEQMDDWGEDGPILGPFRYVHTTYNCELKLGSMDEADGGDSVGPLRIFEDMVYYDGWYYGDWSIYDADIADDKELKHRVVKFDEAKSILPPAIPAKEELKRWINSFPNVRIDDTAAMQDLGQVKNYLQRLEQVAGEKDRPIAVDFQPRKEKPKPVIQNPVERPVIRGLRGQLKDALKEINEGHTMEAAEVIQNLLSLLPKKGG